MNNSNKINLQQMQRFFEGQVESIRTISDLQLSENDYRSLGAKLKSLSFFTGSENDIRDYLLSVVVYSAYSLLYGNEYDDFSAIIRMILHESQYMERIHLRMFRETYEVYGLGTYGVYSSDVKRDCQIITARHAGIPNSEKYYFFDLISQYLQYDEIDNIYNGIYERLPYRTRYIFDLMDDKNRKSLLIESRMLVGDVVSGRFKRDELIKKYQDLSMNLIDYCIMWNDNRNDGRIKNYN